MFTVSQVPIFFHSGSISNPGSNIKEEEGKNELVVLPSFVAINLTKVKIINF